MNLSYALSDAFVARCVGHEALARGFVYAQQGAVDGLAYDRERHLLTGSVTGSVEKPYAVEVDVNLTGKGLHYGTCSCYIGQNCKHVAAVLLRFRMVLAESRPRPEPAAPAAVRPAWERSLEQLSAFRTTTPVVRDDLALRVEATDRGPDRPLRLRCRPVRRGPSGNWVQDGISWSLLEYDWDSRHDPGQRDLLVQLSRLGRAADRYTYYGRGDWVELSDSTRSVWAVLAELREAGVSLVPAGGRKNATVALVDEPAELSLDLRTITLDGDVELAPLVRIDGVEQGWQRLGLVGHPAHGAALEDERGSLRLVAFTDGLDAALQEWLEQQGSLRVPGTDRDRLLTEYVPRLGRRVPLTSHDRSVPLPELPAPRIGLELRHGAAGEVRLGWSVVYRVGEVVHRLDPVDRADGTTLRDLPAETRGWHRVAEETGLFEHWPRLLNRRGHPEPRPDATLHGLDGARFCAETLPALVAAGVEVSQLGPERDYRRSDSAPVIEFSTVEIEDGGAASDWFDLVVDVKIDGELVPFDLLFTALARGDDHLILETGVFFSLDRPEFAELATLIDEARALQDRERRGLRINVSQQSLWDDLVACGTVGAQAERWRQALRSLEAAGGASDLPPVPSGLKAELRGYQRDGFGWLWGLWNAGVGGILADDMGLGKTVQALALVCAVHEASRESRPPFLVVAPTSVVPNWAAEAARFTPGLRVVTIESSTRKSRRELAETVAEADLVITTYTLLRIDAEHYAALDWSGMVLDEAQFVKNHQAKTYAAIRRLGVEFTVAITGTPLENSLMDLWSMLSLTAPGMFPSPNRFAEFYRTPIERGDNAERVERLARLRHRVAPVMLRRTKELVAAELPAKQEQTLELALHPRHARIYSTHLQRERQKVLGLIEDLEENRFSILASLTLLRQLSLDAALVDDLHDGVPSSKIDLLLEMLPELLGEGHRALVFSQFTGFLQRIADRLDAEGVAYSYLDGSTRNRAAVIEEFTSGRTGVFLISLKAGGFGLNLTEADYCFVCDPWWNPAAEAQAVDRAHRIGQTRPVMVYRLVSQDTIEHKVMELKARKADLFRAVMDADGLPAGALDGDDIRALLDA
ncbi:superfamily II DNA or RNA helicase [Friedmanniella endophytica]|uniref:Superfamily II DNA or RNA helicase n=1 Tax=Microlunatus kandeliicorticis TaxID=1759536 RepID=A0A7W3IUX1_9ACTN|nr:DEAD/DEAH box helicase [Microlunatus kandeliicorticis]MBA8795726.1 superfamily II DNA or RNA helicase [Microlunatus kandeliicorticis]